MATRNGIIVFLLGRLSFVPLVKYICSNIVVAAISAPLAIFLVMSSRKKMPPEEV
jgi:hypothetical protein